MKSVELKTAYWWHCEECGSENFSRSIKIELAPGEKEEVYRSFHDLDDYAELPEGWDQFETCHIPDEVCCSFCGAKFATVNERDGGDDGH